MSGRTSGSRQRNLAHVGLLDDLNVVFFELDHVFEQFGHENVRIRVIRPTHRAAIAHAALSREQPMIA